MTAIELITASLRVIQVIATGETPTDAEIRDGFDALNMMLRYWGTKRMLIHYISVENFNLTSGTESYTIGSGGDFDTERPLKITGGYTRSGNIDTPFKVIGEQKYRDISQKSYSGDNTVSWLWYNPSWDKGTIYVYPAAGGVIYLHCLKPLSEPPLFVSTMQFPGEYDDPIKWNLAVRLCPEYGKKVTPELQYLAASTLDQLMAFNASLQVEAAKIEILSLTERYNIDHG